MLRMIRFNDTLEKPYFDDETVMKKEDK